MRILVALFASLCSLTAFAEPLVRIVADENALEGKLQRIQQIATASGARVEYAYTGAVAGYASTWLTDAALVIVEAPLPSAQERVHEQLGEILRGGKARWISGGPRTSMHGGLPREHAERLLAYYRNGGETNLRRLFEYVKVWNSNGDVRDVPPADPLPSSGFYHPDAPRVFATLDEYVRWGQRRWRTGAPRVGLAMHSFAISGMQTQVVDAAVRRSEALGLMPFAFWFDVDDQNALQKVVEPARIDVLVNMHHMGNGSARTQELLALDIPVLQTMNYRNGSAAEWLAAPSGSAPHMVAPFIAVYENWGMIDPIVVSAVDKGELHGMPLQVDAVLRKAKNLTALRRTPNEDKRLGLMFWNYPPGEKNLSASNLNVPRSLRALTDALRAAGYDVRAMDESGFIEAGQAMLGALYRHDALDGLLKRDLAGVLPMKRYRSWLRELPESRRAELIERWGEPEAHWAVRTIEGEQVFVIPRLQLGNVTMMPQMPRGAEPGAAYHDAAMAPNHYYLAAYLYLRESSAPHALIHFGTHGTQEWLPGKDRGLSVDDYPFLAIGDVPVFYPYIQDNIGEALQAKRRGRAVIVSHQTPAFAPSGLYEDLLDVHSLLHEYLQLDAGATRDRTAGRIRQLAVDRNLNEDLDWSEEAMQRDFEGFLTALHDYLHQLARRNTPLGLHTLGVSPAPEHRITTVLQQLGDEFAARAATQSSSAGAHAGHLGMQMAGADEVFSRAATDLQNTAAYRLLHKHLREHAPLSEIVDTPLRSAIERGIALDRHLATNHELTALLRGLSGKFVPPGPGGDPVRNPEVPNGRNLFGFEPDKLPTQSAYEAADDLLQGLIEDYRRKHGRPPEKLAFSLWSVEAMRHMGVTESQVLRAMGLRPVWDKGGRVTKLEIVPAHELQRPRIDAVVQVTGAYRDQFEGFMRLLADAVERLAMLEEQGNTIRRNSHAIARVLQAKGIAQGEAQRLSRARLFGNQPGDYGIGLSDAVLDSTAWENDAPLADQYLSRLQFAYGSGEGAWGVQLQVANLYAEQLKGVQAAVLSRSSNLYGVLSGDDPYQFLGGLSLAVRRLSGASPELYISDVRQPAATRMTSAARFLAEEMRTRYLNPQWITAMQKEGYSGTLEIVDTTNNLWGWQVMDSSTVRADQWQAMHEVYVTDRYKLDIAKWFEQHNPTAQAQVIARMIEAIRKGYWDAAEPTRRELAQRWSELSEQGVVAGAEVTQAFAREMVQGYGLQPSGRPSANRGAEPQAPTQSAISEAEAQPVRGQVLEDASAVPVDENLWRLFAALLALVTCFVLGGIRALREHRALFTPTTRKLVA